MYIDSSQKRIFIDKNHSYHSLADFEENLHGTYMSHCPLSNVIKCMYKMPVHERAL